jgi:hypothetical protein
MKLSRILCYFGKHDFCSCGTVAAVFGTKQNRKALGLPPQLKGDEIFVMCVREGCKFIDIWSKR